MKERFTTGEWAQLKRLPPLMFVFVALADGRLQAEEAEKFAAEIGDASRYRDPLLRELLFDLSQPSEFQTAFEGATRITSTSAEAIDVEITGIKVLLKGKLTDEEYHRFFFSLIGIGKMVADSAGAEKKGIFGHKKAEPAMSPEEAQSLSILAMKFGVDLDAGKRAVESL
ncbi:MAG: hypothetical protein ABIJ48_01125 [Actinomycetota bacterium]